MKQPPPMTPLDELTSSTELRMLKLFLPFLPAASQHTLAVFVKFLEFRQTLMLSLPDEPQLASQNLSDADGLFLENVLQSLRPYLTPQEQQIFEPFENIQNMLSMMELFRTADMSGSMPFPFSSDFESSESVNFHSSGQSSAGANPDQNISDSDKPEPQTFAEIQKGDLTYGKLDEPSRNETDRSCQTGTDQTGSPADSGKEWT